MTGNTFSSTKKKSRSPSLQAATAPVKVRIKQPHKIIEVVLVDPFPENIPYDIAARCQKVDAVPDLIIHRHHQTNYLVPNTFCCMAPVPEISIFSFR